jgi:hypothetical protein
MYFLVAAARKSCCLTGRSFDFLAFLLPFLAMQKGRAQLA